MDLKNDKPIDALLIDDATAVSPLDTASNWSKLWFDQVLLHTAPYHPYLSSTLFSEKFPCAQVTPILSLGNKRQLQPEDMYPVERYMEAGHVYRQFVQLWAAELVRWNGLTGKKSARPSLYRALLKLVGRDMFFQGILQAIFATGQVLGPTLLKAIIVFVSTPTEPLSTGLALAFAYSLVPFFGMICQVLYCSILTDIGREKNTCD